MWKTTEKKVMLTFFAGTDDHAKFSRLIRVSLICYAVSFSVLNEFKISEIVQSYMVTYDSVI